MGLRLCVSGKIPSPAWVLITWKLVRPARTYIQIRNCISTRPRRVKCTFRVERLCSNPKPLFVNKETRKRRQGQGPAAHRHLMKQVLETGP